jgi:hypothetical protein
MVRDVFHISGFLAVDALGQIVQVGLNQATPLAPVVTDSLRELLAATSMDIHLDTISFASQTMIANWHQI